MAQQANAQGITWVASAGDSGAAGCDAHGFFGATGNATTVSDGPAVSIPASFPEVTAVGGTQFNEGSGHYWNSSNNANGASAISYIPEMVWNETGAGGLLASGGGASIFFSKPRLAGRPRSARRQCPRCPRYLLQRLRQSRPVHGGQRQRAEGHRRHVGRVRRRSPEFWRCSPSTWSLAALRRKPAWEMSIPNCIAWPAPPPTFSTILPRETTWCHARREAPAA